MTVFALYLYFVDKWFMGRVTIKLFPAFDGTFLQLFLGPNHLKRFAVLTFVNRQSKTPISVFFADEPIMHIFQPV